MSQKHLILIVGPTAIGKTKTSIALAKHFSSEIISADSRQFYKEMSLGTAVPSPQDLEEVPHHFIQHLSVNEDYNVGEYEIESLQLIDQKFKQYDLLFLVGGSGLYIDAVVKGLDYFPEVSPEIRKGLQKVFLEKGIHILQEKLKILDSVYYEKVDLNNAHRLIRALEVCIGTGKPYSSFLGKKENERDFKVIKIGLNAEREFLYQRINKRVDQMMADGLLKEAKKLYEKKYLNALQTVGYKELFAYLDNEFNLDQAVEEIKKNTRRYAKRQITWLRKDKNIEWFEHDEDLEKIIDYIKLKTS